MTAAGRAAAEPLVEVSNLSKDFPMRDSSKVIRAVQDVEFRIGPGETLGPCRRKRVGQDDGGPLPSAP